MRKLVKILLFLCLLIAPYKVAASDYNITSYDVNIVVNENNTFDITEKITAYFNVPKHGIYRTIPLKNEIKRLDGTISKNRTRVSNVSVSETYSKSVSNGNYKIKIGDPDYTITGMKEYVISYTYNLGKDPLKDKDELYFNIIGTKWDTQIENISFKIQMPKDFDASKLGFSAGNFGSIESNRVLYTIDGNTIIGSYLGYLDAYEGLTIRCELPEGYFVGAGLGFNYAIIIMFIIPIIGLIISVYLWFKYGRDDQVIETVEFYPPDGLNSLEVGFLYKGKAEDKDVTSLLVYLANCGYIKISETLEKSLFSKSKGFRITKIKEYDGNNINEKLFLKGLFSKKSGVDFFKVSSIMKQAKQNGEKLSYKEAMKMATDNNSLESVTAKDLYDSFYITMGKIKSNINNKTNRNKIFEKKASGKLGIVIFLMIVSLLSTIIIPTMDYAGTSELFMTLMLCLIYIPFYIAGIYIKPMAFKIFWIGFTFCHSLIFFITLPIVEAMKDNLLYLIAVLFGLGCFIGMALMLKIMPKRTPYGNEMLGKIKGFKNFLQTAEKEKLEMMVMQNPTYFYNILPFTYVLGISDKWIKKFEDIALQAPDWYDGTTGFNITSFGSFMNSTMTSAQSAMSSSPSSDSGSGGGSSGGGSGGGGGGSW